RGAVAAEAADPGAGDRADFARRVHHAQGVAAALQDVDVALAVHRHGARIDQRRRAGVGAGGGHALLAVAGDGVDDAGLQVEGAHAAVVQVGEVEPFAGRVEGDAVDAAELRLDGRTA